MTEPETKIAVLENRVENQKERIEKLEGNQKWVVFALIGSLIKMLFDFMQRGGGQ